MFMGFYVLSQLAAEIYEIKSCYLSVGSKSGMLVIMVMLVELQGL
jgi:hypothetical protein